MLTALTKVSQRIFYSLLFNNIRYDVCSSLIRFSSLIQIDWLGIQMLMRTTENNLNSTREQNEDIKNTRKTLIENTRLKNKKTREDEEKQSTNKNVLFICDFWYWIFCVHKIDFIWMLCYDCMVMLCIIN